MWRDVTRSVCSDNHQTGGKDASPTHGSPLVTRRPGERVGFFHEEPILAEREFTRWLTVENHYFSQGEEKSRTNDYDTELLDEFVAELPECIAYWG